MSRRDAADPPARRAAYQRTSTSAAAAPQPTAVPDAGSGLRNTVLVTTMISTAFYILMIAVLASTFIDEFGLSRFQLGLLGSLNAGVGAISAPLTGRLTDRIGARESAVAAQMLCVVGFIILATAQNIQMMIVAAALAGIPQGWGNPITNALIAERVPLGRRGRVTGIKQSGVQVGIFLAGATLPALNSLVGWRGAMWIYVGLFLISALVPLLLPAHVSGFETSGSDEPAPEPVDHRPYDQRAMWLLSLYAFLMGTAGGAISRFLALFGEEEVGMSNATAGLVVALSGFVGIFVRVAAGQLAERRIAPLRLLSILSLVSAVVTLLLLVTIQVGAWLLWPVALLFAVGFGAWTAVAMLAIILGIPKAQSGRASGAVMFGFLGGLSVGAPIAGLVVDATNSYQPVWIGALVLALTSALVAEYASR